MAEMEMNVPDGWHKKTVAGFALKMRSGGTPKSDNPNYYNGEIPFVSIEDLTSANKYLDKTHKHITKAGLDNSSAWLVPENTLLYSIYATLGVPRITTIEAATNQAILGIIPDPKQIDLGFLFYLLLEKRQTILAHSSHTTQSNLNAKIVKELEFVFPDSLTEQRQIARILSKVDEAISQTEQLIAKYRRLKMGLMQDLLTKGIDAHGNIRSEKTHAFKDSPLGRIPAEWATTPINELCELIVDCKNRTSPFVEKSEFPVIRTSNIKNGELVWNDMKYTDAVSYKIWTDRAIPVADDVIITREAPLGQVIKIPAGLTPILGQRTMHFRLDKTKLLPDFLVYLILDERMQKYLHSIGDGSTVHHLKVGEMKTLLISHPKSVVEQAEIEQRINSQEKGISTLKLNLAKLQSLKTGLMQDLLTGKVRVEQLIREMADA